MTKKKGYTLIELLIVLALFCLFLSLTLPNFNILNRIKENRELKELKRDLLYYRNMAIMENFQYIFTFDIERNRYTVYKSGEVAAIKSKDLNYGVKLISKPIENDLTFNPSGAPSGAGTIVILNSLGQRYEFRVTPVTGKTNVYLIK